MSKEQAQVLIERFKAFGIKAGNFWGPKKTVAGVKIAAKDAEQALASLDNAVLSAVRAFVEANTDLEASEVGEALNGAQSATEALTALVTMAGDGSGLFNGVVE